MVDNVTMDAMKKSLNQAGRTLRKVSDYVSSAFWLEPASGRAERLFRKGRAFYSERFYPEAIENLRAALAFEGLPQEHECEAQFLLGDSYIRMNEFSSALAALEIACRAIRENTDPALKCDVYLNRGFCYKQMRQLQLSSDDYGAAANTASLANDIDRSVEALINKAKVDLENNELEIAAKAVDALLSKNPDHPEAKLLQMDIYLQLRRYTELTTLFDLVFEEHKGDLDFSQKQLGKIFAIKGTSEFRNQNFSGAVESLTKALECDSGLTDAKRLRGIAFFKLDQFRNGLHDLIEGVEVADTIPTDLKQLNSNIDEKVQMLEKVIKIPDEFYCPITHLVMKDPVVAHDGFSYERSAIEEWLSNNNTSPMTNKELMDKTLRPNIVLRNSIGDLRELMPSIFSGEEEEDDDPEPGVIEEKN
jgi:tetratricopeptide (TPR) repeat protein